jgi:hypothetical protein
MEDHDGRTRYVERVVLPSGKSINGISFEPPTGTEVPPDISGAPEHPFAEVAGALGADQQWTSSTPSSRRSPVRRFGGSGGGVARRQGRRLCLRGLRLSAHARRNQTKGLQEQ